MWKRFEEVVRVATDSLYIRLTGRPGNNKEIPVKVLGMSFEVEETKEE